jgi:hypothetical protein
MSSYRCIYLFKHGYDILQNNVWFNIGSVESFERNLEAAQSENGVEPINFVNVVYKNDINK